jgi:5-methylcytosine-specific restriction enzyme subunit McrC
MSKVMVVREAFDWLEPRANSDFTEEDMRELLLYMSRTYPKTEWCEIGYNRLRFINVVGTIRLTRIQIDIIPKLTVDDTEGYASLINMLSVCGYVPYRTGFSFSSVQSVKTDLLTWLAATFCYELEEQLKRGMPAGYVTMEENSLRLKGRVLISSHLRMNTADRTRVYCSFDERMTGVPLNFIFYKALLILIKKIRDANLKKKIQHLFVYFQELSDPGDVKSLLDKIKFDRQSTRFEHAYRLARLILLKMSTLHRGSGEECLSFLFEVNTLYEAYIGTILKQLPLGERALVRLQHEEVKLLKNNDSGKDNIQLKPDIVLGYQQEDGREAWTLVIDTKWKRAYYQQEDIYQMYAYVTGYREARRAVLLYPQTDEPAPNRNWALTADSSKQIHIRTVRIHSLEKTKEDLEEILREFY